MNPFLIFVYVMIAVGLGMLWLAERIKYEPVDYQLRIAKRCGIVSMAIMVVGIVVLLIFGI